MPAKVSLSGIVVNYSLFFSYAPPPGFSE